MLSTFPFTKTLGGVFMIYGLIPGVYTTFSSTTGGAIFTSCLPCWEGNFSVRLLWGGCSRFQDPGHSLCRHGGSACVFDLLIFSMDVGGHGNILGSSWI